MIDYDWIKNHYRLLAVDLSIEKELDAGPEAIQQIEFVGHLKKLDGDSKATDASNDQTMFVLMIFKKIKEVRLTFLQRSITVL